MTDAPVKSNTLLRAVKVGEKLSFDGGRVVLTLQERTGRSACLRIQMHEDVVVDKPQGRTPLAIEKTRDSL